MNCNKIKQLKAKSEDIIEAVKDSKDVELSKDKKKVRRAGNAALPAVDSSKKRDAKASSKEESKQGE